MTNPVVLITDFGTKDPYAAVMKGVFLSKNKNINIIDATHEISSQNTAEAAFFLNSVIEWYPEGSVFVCVVDPGVGSKREILVLKSKNRLITAPDNGIVSEVIKNHGEQEVYKVAKEGFNSKSTFDGRDIFAPVGAELAEKGTDLFFLKKISVKNIVIKDFFPDPFFKKNLISGNIVKTDKFGNFITNISKNMALSFFKDLKNLKVFAGELEIGKIVHTYSSKEEGSLSALWNSNDFLEISCVSGSAEKKFNKLGKETIVLKKCS
jgi:S-adenosylmethionine hydrolase